MEDYIEFDKLKTKVLKYALYKKRSEAEIRRKFAENSGEMLDEVIENLKENGYINDFLYIQRTVDEFQRLKNLSIKELEYKLLSKGINKHDLEEYISKQRRFIRIWNKFCKKYIYKKASNNEKRRYCTIFKEKRIFKWKHYTCTRLEGENNGNEWYTNFGNKKI